MSCCPPTDRRWRTSLALSSHITDVGDWAPHSHPVHRGRFGKRRCPACGLGGRNAPRDRRCRRHGGAVERRRRREAGVISSPAPSRARSASAATARSCCSARATVPFVLDANTGLPAGPPLAADVAGIVDIAESSADGRLVSVGEDGMVIEVSTRHRTSPESVIARAPSSRLLATDRTGTSIAVARNDGAVDVRRIADGAVQGSMRERPGDQSVGVFGALDRTLWLGGNDGRLWRWGLRPGEEPRNAARYDGSPLAISADGRYVAARQNASTGNVVVQGRRRSHDRAVRRAASQATAGRRRSSDDGRLAVAFSDGTVDILDPTSPVGLSIGADGSSRVPWRTLPTARTAGYSRPSAATAPCDSGRSTMAPRTARRSARAAGASTTWPSCRAVGWWPRSATPAPVLGSRAAGAAW